MPLGDEVAGDVPETPEPEVVADNTLTPVSVAEAVMSTTVVVEELLWPPPLPLPLPRPDPWEFVGEGAMLDVNGEKNDRVLVSCGRDQFDHV